MYNWHHSDRWRLHLRQFLGRRDRQNRWTPFTPGELNGDNLELRGDDNRLQFRITIHPNNWLFIEGQTEAARNLVDTFGHIASNGPSGSRRLHELHRLISYSGGGGTRPAQAAAPHDRARLEQERDAALRARNIAQESQQAPQEKVTRLREERDTARDSSKRHHDELVDEKQKTLRLLDERDAAREDEEKSARQVEQLVQLCRDHNVPLPPEFAVKQEPKECHAG